MKNYNNLFGSNFSLRNLTYLDKERDVNSHNYSIYPYTIITNNLVSSCIKPRAPFAHKGAFGSALLIAGSYGMAGAALLSAKAALRSGVGLLTLHIPRCNRIITQSSIPEAIVTTDNNETHYSAITAAEKFQAIAIGPGLGQHHDSLEALKEQLSYCKHPIIIDADGINLLANFPEMICRLPIGSILTPHEGELDRLLGTSRTRKERIEKARQWCKIHKSHIILKGAFTTVIAPNSHLFFNSTGNPGMATAGSGDVLTGILLGLLSQGFSPLKTCLIGVYIHGLAGDLAANQKTQMGLIASDIVAYLPYAWNKLSVK